MKSEFPFFQSLSWLFQLASLTLSNASELFWSWISINHIQVHEEKENFVIACLHLSQNVKLGIFMWQLCSESKEMYKKVWCTCKVVVLPCQAIAFFTFSLPLHLKLPIIYDTLRYVRNRIFPVQIELLMIASETFFDSSVVPLFVVRKAWWTNQATVAR